MAKYFTESEMTCKCGCNQTRVNKRLFPLLDRIRETIGKPVYILSGYRCESHNAAVGGATSSYHMTGAAADITYDGCDVNYLSDVAIDCGATAVGSYSNQGFVHVDVRLPILWEE